MANLIQSAGCLIKRAGFALNKNLPEILLWGGIGLGAASTVSACVATVDATEVIKSMKLNLELSDKIVDENGDTDEAEAKRMRTRVYMRTIGQLMKLYAPAAGLGAASAACLISSNHISRKRSAALAAAYVALDNSFRKYRKNVNDKYGAESDRELRFTERERTTNTVINDETGEEATIISVDNRPVAYGTAFEFNETCRGHMNDPAYNIAFLEGQERYANNLLMTRSYLFLNEVYAALGKEPTVEGHVLGWIWDSENPENNPGVRFCVFETSRFNELTGEVEQVLLLEPNVQGPILEKVAKLGLMANE